MPKAITAAESTTIRMRVTEAERRLLLARRGADPPYRMPVITGYKEPSTIPELVEVVRCFLEANFGWIIDEHHRDLHRMEIQGDLYSEGLSHTSIFFADGDFPDGTVPTLSRDELKHLEKYRAEREARYARKREAAARKGAADGR